MRLCRSFLSKALAAFSWRSSVVSEPTDKADPDCAAKKKAFDECAVWADVPHFGMLAYPESGDELSSAL
jgi:hypothetical protein